MRASEHMKFEPLSIHEFMYNFLNKNDDRSLLDRYKDYLIQNNFQHHYGTYGDMQSWLDNALRAYHKQCKGE